MACHGALQGQMQPLQCEGGMEGPALGLLLGSAGGSQGLRFGQFVEIFRGGGSIHQPQPKEPCQCVSGQPWACRGALQFQMQPLLCASEVVGPALGAATELGRWFVGVVVLPVCGNFQRRRQHSATTAHRALPVFLWPALGMPWGTARSNTASAVCSMCGGACTGCCRRAEQVVYEGCDFAFFWRFSEEERALGNHSAQSPACV